MEYLYRKNVKEEINLDDDDDINNNMNNIIYRRDRKLSILTGIENITPKIAYFLIFGAKGALLPYLPLYYESLGYSSFKIGLLCSIPALISFITAPLWSLLADFLNLHRSLLIPLMFFSSISLICVYHFNTFTSLSIFLSLYSLFNAPLMPIIDSTVQNYLKSVSQFGEQRKYGAIGFGLFSFLSGILSIYDGYLGMFYLYSILMISSILIISYFDDASFDDLHLPKNIKKTLYHVLKRPYVINFYIIVAISGFGYGLIDTFLYVRLRDLGGSLILIGFSRLITSFSEIPFFHYFSSFIKNFDIMTLFFVSQFFFIIRLIYYSYLDQLISPWLILPTEPLHGLTYALMWSGSVRYARSIAPLQLNSTMQSFVEASHQGIGYLFGSLFGGLMWKYFGPDYTFRIVAFICLFSIILTFITYIHDKNAKNEKIKIKQNIELNKVKLDEIIIGYDDENSHHLSIKELNKAESRKTIFQLLNSENDMVYNTLHQNDNDNDDDDINNNNNNNNSNNDNIFTYKEINHQNIDEKKIKKEIII